MDENDKPIIVLTAGGTGGHIYPAAALALVLEDRGFRPVLITDRRGSRYDGFLNHIKIFKIRACGIAGKGFFGKIQSLCELAVGIFQARILLTKLNPSLVIGFGGYASAPTMIAACYGKFKTLIHEQNFILGRANRFLSARVNLIATSFELAEGELFRNQKARYTGMPVRPIVEMKSNQQYSIFGVNPILKILVIGGSQGASVFSKIIPEALKKLDYGIRSRIQITQQCRFEDLNFVRVQYSSLGVKADLSVFFEDISKKMSDCHLLISRAGASTIAEATVMGRPLMLVPYPHAADDHQSKNALAVESFGAGWVIKEEMFTGDILAKRLREFIELPAILVKAANCAKMMGKSDAASELANLVCELVGDNLSHNSREKDFA